MSVRTIYKCDKCSSETEKNEQFWTVGVTANAQLYTSRDFVTGFSMQVCRPCLESLGIHVRTKPADGQEAPPRPTLEEVILEIVRTGLNV